jgi:hypothetical protein
VAQAPHGYTHDVAHDQIVLLVYLDSRGHRVTRRVVPDRIWFGHTDWVTEPQWLLDVLDVERGLSRSYPMQQIELFTPDTLQGVPNGPAATRAPA